MKQKRLSHNDLKQDKPWSNHTVNIYEHNYRVCTVDNKRWFYWVDSDIQGRSGTSVRSIDLSVGNCECLGRNKLHHCRLNQYPLMKSEKVKKFNLILLSISTNIKILEYTLFTKNIQLQNYVCKRNQHKVTHWSKLSTNKPQKRLLNMLSD